MHFPTLAVIFAGCSVAPTALAAPAKLAARSCTSAQRLAAVEIIPYAYNLVAPGASAAAFATLPLEDDCMTSIVANGAPPITVGIDSTTTLDFAINTRQLFSKVTGTYTDNADGVTIIHTNVTLGALHSEAVPITFYADVYCTFNLDDCAIDKIEAFATIPTVIAGVPVNPPILTSLLAASPLGLL